MYYLHNGTTMALGIVYVEGNEILSLNSRTLLIIDSHILSLKAQLEQFALRDGYLHLSMLAGNLCLNDVVISCQSKG